MKCKECAEYENCYAGRHGEGKENCPMFFPCASSTPKGILEVEEKIDELRIAYVKEYLKNNTVLNTENFTYREYLDFYLMLLIEAENKKTVDKIK